MDLIKIKEKLRYEPDTGYIFRNDTRKKTGTKSASGHIVLTVNGKLYLAHRLAWLLTYGEIPDKWVIDHIDHNPQNNKLDNLRCVPHKHNLRNQKKRITNTTGCMGVYKHGDRWRSRIKVNGVFKHIGIYDSFEDAVKARKEAEQIYGFHANHGT